MISLYVIVRVTPVRTCIHDLWEENKTKKESILSNL